MAIRLVVTDMDNTLYSWIDYIVPAVEAMVESVCRSTDLPKIRVVQALKEVYTRYESNEYPFVLQESSLYAELRDFGSFDKLVIQPARSAFAEARRKFLRPYKEVTATLEALKARGVPVVALTDAPRNPAEYRAKLMGFDRLLAGLYTLPGFQFPASPDGQALVAPDIVRRDERGDYRAACAVVELPREYEKPSARGLEEILRKWNVAAKDTVVVGDSLKKDVAVAKELGAVDCWAEYGTYVSNEYRERLDIISAAAITRRHAASVFEGERPAGVQQATHELSNFGQLLRVVDAHG